MNLLIWFKAEGIAYAMICFLIINLITEFKMKFRLIFSLLFVSFVFFKSLIYNYFHYPNQQALLLSKGKVHLQ